MLRSLAHRFVHYAGAVVGIVYLAALIIGLGTLTLQLVLSHIDGGDHADADGHMDAEAHLHADVHDLAVDAGHELDHADAGTHDGADSAASMLLSMRFWTYALMAFGLVGTALHYLALAGAVLTPVLAVVAGLCSGTTAALVFRALKPAVSSATTQDETLGRVARVTVPVRKGGLGKVRVEMRGRHIDLLAVSDRSDVDPGEQVVVVEFRGNHALVEPLRTRDE